MSKAAKLIMIRHGESIWNKLNVFTGWVDIPLSEKGIEESYQVGKKIADMPIDIIFTSSLIRAQMTAMLAMLHHKSGKLPVVQHPHEGKLEKWSKIYEEKTVEKSIPVFNAWQLNERMYGKLQGLDKKETAEKFGAEQVQIWRRSFDVAPPEGESLAMTAERSIPYFKENILPHLQKGKDVMICAHGNSLRSIVMFLDNLSKEEILKLEIATGEIIIYDFFDNKWKKEKLHG